MPGRFWRLFDFGRMCRWTAYAAGASHARKMDIPFPQPAHAAAHVTPAHPPERAKAEEESAAGAETASTNFEALQIQAGELAASTLLAKWQAQRYGLASPVRLWAVEARRIWPALEQHLKEHKEKRYVRSKQWPRIALWAVLGLFAMPEYPLTRSAFDVFRMTRPETMLAAVGACLALVFLADIIGKALRQKQWGVVHTLSLLTLVAALFSLATLRSSFLEETAMQRRARLAAGAAALATTPAPAAPIPTGGQPTLTLGVLAALFMVAGIVVGYLAHDSDPAVHDIVTARRHAERDLRRALRKLVAAAAAYDGQRGKVLLTLHGTRERTLMTIREYRYANELWRLPDTGSPGSFREAVNEDIFKPRDVGPELLPLAQALEQLMDRDSSMAAKQAVERLVDVASAEPSHA